MKCGAYFNLVTTDFRDTTTVSMFSREQVTFPPEIVPAGAYFICFLGAVKNSHRKNAKTAAKGIVGIFPHLPKNILTAYPQVGLFNLHSLREVQILGDMDLSY